jgi:hypothetical protein
LVCFATSTALPATRAASSAFSSDLAMTGAHLLSAGRDGLHVAGDLLGRRGDDVRLRRGWSAELAIVLETSVSSELEPRRTWRCEPGPRSRSAWSDGRVQVGGHRTDLVAATDGSGPREVAVSHAAQHLAHRDQGAGRSAERCGRRP